MAGASGMTSVDSMSSSDVASPASTTSPNAYLEDERRWLPALAVFMVLLAGIGMIEPDEIRSRDVVVVLLPSLAVAIRTLTPRLPRWWVFPVAAFAALLPNLPDSETEGVLFLPIAAVTYVAVFEPRRWISYTCTFLAAASPVIALIWIDPGSFGWQFWMTGAVLGGGFGDVGYRYRARLDELRDAREALADQAVLDERRRIARDVHDLVGHSLSVVMLQVTAARELVRIDPDEAEAALDDAARVGRESMGEIRQTIGLLRSSEGDGTAPAPTLSDLDDLVGQYRAAGLAVDVESSGTIDAIDRTRSIAAYRIVQEALANVSKHGSGTRAAVSVNVDADVCRITISNPTPETVRLGTQGFGLVGMRERAQSVGGTLTAGPHGAAWLVDASLPITSPGSTVGST